MRLLVSAVLTALLVVCAYSCTSCKGLKSIDISVDPEWETISVPSNSIVVLPATNGIRLQRVQP